MRLLMGMLNPPLTKMPFMLKIFGYVSLLALMACQDVSAVEKSQETSIAKGVSFSSGLGITTQSDIVRCEGGRSRPSDIGIITSEDGKVWNLPADVHFNTAPKAFDLYDDCRGVTHRSLADVNIDEVPVYNAGGDEEFRAYVYGDNYFEFFVNGKVIAVDSVPYTPFNSTMIRFKAKRPFTVGFMGVDWEENLGIGTESSRGGQFHAGDAGLVAHIQTATGETVAMTDESWRAQTFYTAPLADRSCLRIDGALRDSSACPESGMSSADQISAAHWDIPGNWSDNSFEETLWPKAVTYTNAEIRVGRSSSYGNFADVFDGQDNDPQFIWSSNLVLDNVVLMRKTIE